MNQPLSTRQSKKRSDTAPRITTSSDDENLFNTNILKKSGHIKKISRRKGLIAEGEEKPDGYKLYMRKLLRRQGKLFVRSQFFPDNKSDVGARLTQGLGDQEGTTDFSDDFRSLPVDGEYYNCLNGPDSMSDSPRSTTSQNSSHGSLKIIIDEQTEARCVGQPAQTHPIDLEKNNRDNRIEGILKLSDSTERKIKEVRFEDSIQDLIFVIEALKPDNQITTQSYTRKELMDCDAPLLLKYYENSLEFQQHPDFSGSRLWLGMTA